MMNDMITNTQKSPAVVRFSSKPNEQTTLSYDGSFNGFLTAIFIAFERRLNVAGIQSNGKRQNNLFSKTEAIRTHLGKARRVWNVLHHKNHHALTTLYFAFLSEEPNIEKPLYQWIRKLMYGKDAVDWTEEQQWMSKIQDLAAQVSHEKRRVEKFISFEVLDDGMYFASISPKFNVLPLISKYVRTRNIGKQWSIYDKKRKYGLYCATDHVEMVPWCATDRKAV